MLLLCNQNIPLAKVQRLQSMFIVELFMFITHKSQLSHAAFHISAKFTAVIAQVNAHFCQWFPSLKKHTSHLQASLRDSLPYLVLVVFSRWAKPSFLVISPMGWLICKKRRFGHRMTICRSPVLHRKVQPSNFTFYWEKNPGCNLATGNLAAQAKLYVPWDRIIPESMGLI